MEIAELGMESGELYLDESMPMYWFTSSGVIFLEKFKRQTS